MERVVLRVPQVVLGGSRRAPRIGTYFVAGASLLAAFSLLTGFFDVALPALVDRPRFPILFALAGAFGPGYLFVHIFLHNLGLALLVPGVGLLAASFEKDPRNRRHIGPILAIAAIGSLLVAVDLVIRRGYWKESVVIGLFLVEAGAVVLATWAGLRALRGYVPTPKPAWGWIQPARDMAPYVAVAAVALAFGAFVETLYVGSTVGL